LDRCPQGNVLFKKLMIVSSRQLNSTDARRRTEETVSSPAEIQFIEYIHIEIETWFCVPVGIRIDTEKLVNAGV
jgi:hypothetical protein